MYYVFNICRMNAQMTSLGIIFCRASECGHPLIMVKKKKIKTLTLKVFYMYIKKMNKYDKTIC